MGINDFVTKGLNVLQKIEHTKNEMIETQKKFEEMCLNIDVVPSLFGIKEKRAIKKILNAIEEKYQKKINEFEDELDEIYEQCPFHEKGCSSGSILGYCFFE